MRNLSGSSSHPSGVDTVVVEELEVFAVPTAVQNLQLSSPSEGEKKLLVITDDSVTALPLHRCYLAATCG